MDGLIQFLIAYGHIGMFIGAFLGGSILPFASEAVLIALYKAGLDPVMLIISSSAGNTLGSMTCYYMGHLGRMEWIEKYMKVKPENMQKAERFMHGRGAWMGFFSFLPIIGNAINIILGLMHANVWITMLAITLGNIVRYGLFILAAAGVFTLFTSL